MSLTYHYNVRKKAYPRGADGRILTNFKRQWLYSLESENFY